MLVKHKKALTDTFSHQSIEILSCLKKIHLY